MKSSEAKAPAQQDRPRPKWEQEGLLWAGAEEASRFFAGKAAVQRAAKKIAQLLDQNGIPYAITGGMALNAYGFKRVTNDVDLLLTQAGRDAFRALHPEPTELGVRIDIVVTGEYPGDRQPKPVAYPDPATTAIRGEHWAMLPLPLVLELKLASGISAPHRLKDLADVLETIRALKLPAELVDQLNPYVQDKYRELWQAAQAKERD